MIINALRALRPPPSQLRLAAADTDLTERFAHEHQAIWADIEQLRAAVDGLGVIPPAEAILSLRTAEEDENYLSLADSPGPANAIPGVSGSARPAGRR